MEHLHYCIGVIKNNPIEWFAVIVDKNASGIDLSVWKLALEFCGYTPVWGIVERHILNGKNSRSESVIGLLTE